MFFLTEAQELDSKLPNQAKLISSGRCWEYGVEVGYTCKQLDLISPKYSQNMHRSDFMKC